jgi:hypothetical protein
MARVLMERGAWLLAQSTSLENGRAHIQELENWLGVCGEKFGTPLRLHEDAALLFLNLEIRKKKLALEKLMQAEGLG